MGALNEYYCAHGEGLWCKHSCLPFSSLSFPLVHTRRWLLSAQQLHECEQ